VDNFSVFCRVKAKCTCLFSHPAHLLLHPVSQILKPAHSSLLSTFQFPFYFQSLENAD